MKPEYEAYLNYLECDHWKNLRLLKFKQVGRQCECCESNEQLHIHHIRYRNYFDCNVDDLAVLCEICHDTLHLILKRAKREPEDFEVHQIRDLVTTYQQSPQGQHRRERIVGKRAKRLETRRAYRAKKKTIRRMLLAVSRAQYSDKAIRECIAQLTAMVGDPVAAPAEVQPTKPKRAGWTKAVLAGWGVPWPPPKGWKKDLEAKGISCRVESVALFGH